MNCIEPDRNDQGSDGMKFCLYGYEWSCQMKERLHNSDRHYLAPDVIAQTIANLEESYEFLTGRSRPHVREFSYLADT